MRHHHKLLLALLIALVSGIICFFWLASRNIGAADFTWPWRGAQLLLQGENPYKIIRATGPYPYNDALYYPLPALLIAIPTTFVPANLAGALFITFSAGVLAWAIVNTERHRLPLFVSAPFVYALLTAQWAPLITAAAFLPWLGPALLGKPNIGVPILLLYGNRKSWLFSASVVLLSLLILPGWPLDWYASLKTHLNYTPMLSWFGPFLLLALLRWRQRSARLLLLMAIIPQRLLYDQLNLWLIPQTFRQSFILSVSSWFGFILGLILGQGSWALVWSYLPALAMVLMQTSVKDKETA